MKEVDYRVEQWSEDAWLAADKEHCQALAASDADPLFNSWLWTTLWWRVFGSNLDAELCVLAVYRKDILVGIAPFYCRREWRKGFLLTTTVQLVGMSWRNLEVQLTEYLDIVATEDDYPAVQKICIERIKEQYPYSELIIVSTRKSDVWMRVLKQQAVGRSSYVRVTDESVSRQADLADGFSAYLSKLKASARRSLVNLRRRLESHGKVEFVVIDAEEDALEALHELNSLHATRWGCIAFAGDRLEFHSKLVVAAMMQGILQMSRLVVGGRVVSVMYDIRLGTRQYNLQMGFDQRFDSKLSLGLLHLGFSIEKAAQDGVTIYDFLAGRGKNADYKRHLSQQSVELGSVQYIGGYMHSCLYRSYDAFRPAKDRLLRTIKTT